MPAQNNGETARDSLTRHRETIAETAGATPQVTMLNALIRKGFLRETMTGE